MKSEIELHLGKRDARPGAVLLELREFVSPRALAAIPAAFGHENLISSYGMQGNDRAGNCVEADGVHRAMVYNAEGAHKVSFAADAGIKLYEAITGYDPKQPSTDQGTDMAVAASYWRKTGVKDMKGTAHKVAAYLSLKAGDLQEFLYAAYWFGGVSIGIQFPAFAMDQFNQGKPWDVQKANAKNEGGHCIPILAKRNTLEVCTWGKLQGMTPAFFAKYCDEGIAYLSTEILSGTGTTPEGLNLAALQDAFKNVTQTG